MGEVSAHIQCCFTASLAQHWPLTDQAAIDIGDLFWGFPLKNTSIFWPTDSSFKHRVGLQQTKILPKSSFFCLQIFSVLQDCQVSLADLPYIIYIFTFSHFQKQKLREKTNNLVVWVTVSIIWHVFGMWNSICSAYLLFF